MVNCLCFSWKELLPKVLCEVETQKDVEYAGAEMSGVEFKHRVIQVVCSTSWNPGIVTSLAAMFMYVSAENICLVAF